MFKKASLFHPLQVETSVELPKQFTFPFYYEPHELSVKAAEEVKSYFNSQTDFEHNFGKGSKKNLYLWPR